MFGAAKRDELSTMQYSAGAASLELVSFDFGDPLVWRVQRALTRREPVGHFALSSDPREIRSDWLRPSAR